MAMLCHPLVGEDRVGGWAGGLVEVVGQEDGTSGNFNGWVAGGGWWWEVVGLCGGVVGLMLVAMMML